MNKFITTTGTALLVFNQNNEVLIGKRLKQTGFGQYAAPGGAVEKHESPRAAARRELYEETGLLASELDYVTHTQHIEEDGIERITYWYKPISWIGILENKEPEKSAGWEWHPLHDLPNKLWMGLSEVLEIKT